MAARRAIPAPAKGLPAELPAVVVALASEEVLEASSLPVLEGSSEELSLVTVVMVETGVPVIEPVGSGVTEPMTVVVAEGSMRLSV